MSKYVDFYEMHPWSSKVLDYLVLVIFLGILTGCVRFQKNVSDTPSGLNIIEDDTTVGVPVDTLTPPEFLPYAFQPTTFGILAVVPGGTGSTSDVTVLQAISDTQARYVRVSLDWAISEPEPGNLSFDTQNDRILTRIEQAGLRTFPTLYVGRGWMNGDPPGRDEAGSRSFPPKDLADDWDEQFGYSSSYYYFLTRFFTHYRGRFDYVAIENEADSKLFWGGSAEAYIRLLATAYKAIEDTDPQVKVVNGGFVSMTLGLCIAEDYINRGLKTKEEITQLAIQYYSTETTRIKIHSVDDLDEALKTPQVQEQCQRINDMIDHLAGIADALNFHFYEDYRAMPMVTEWLRLRMQHAGYAIPLVTNELGMRGPDRAFAESDAHARDVFKKMISTIVTGLEAVVWFSVDSADLGNDKVGLFGEGGTIRPAADAFKLVIKILDGAYRLKTVISTGPTLFHYVFEDSGNGPVLEAMWAEGNSLFVDLNAPAGSSQARVLAYTGQSYIITAENGTIELLVGEGPLFVLWE